MSNELMAFISGALSGGLVVCLILILKATVNRPVTDDEWDNVYLKVVVKKLSEIVYLLEQKENGKQKRKGSTKADINKK